jgi:hypothetical protein
MLRPSGWKFLFGNKEIKSYSNKFLLIIIKYDCKIIYETMNHNKINISEFNYLFGLITVLAALILPNKSMPYMIVIEILFLMSCNIKLKSYSILLLGFLFYMLNVIIISEYDVRYMLPFVLYFFLANNSANNDFFIYYRGMNIVILIWICTVVLFLILNIAFPQIADNIIRDFYYTEGYEDFIYDMEFMSQFRFGGYYFNPNQLAYIVALIMLFSDRLKIKEKYINYICIVAIILTQSRGLLGAYILYKLNKKNGAILFILVPFLLLLLLIAYFGYEIEFRMLSNLPDTLEHLLYKFYMLERLEGVEFSNLIFGSGYNKNLFFDADFGSMIYYYGFMSFILFYIIHKSLIKIIGVYAANIFMLLTLFGTIITNTRMVVVIGAFMCFLQLNKRR